MTFNQAGRRFVGAVSFDPDNYENLRDEPSMTVYAVGVVVVCTLLGAIGGLLWAAFFSAPPPEIYNVDIDHFIRNSVILGSIFQIALWFFWVGITWFYLNQIYRLPNVSFPGLVRTMGFAFAPMAIQFLLFLPVLEFPIGIIAVGGTVACSVIAARAASGATLSQALIATMAGFIVFALALGMLGTSDADLAPGIFALDPNSISIALELKRAGS
ncbi:MAG: hypothetical protein ACRDJE_25935 [Dehalococcoidia bacterium]